LGTRPEVTEGWWKLVTRRERQVVCDCNPSTQDVEEEDHELRSLRPAWTM
jgi:hypothetical protein